MKWDDIPQFPKAHYKVHVSWGHVEEQLEALGEGLELRLDPDFQRAHVWTPEQQSAYIEFQLMGGEISQTIVWNAPTWNDLAGRHPELDYIELVDGKQRLEAVRGFMRGEVRAFGRTLHEMEGKLPPMRYMLQFHVCCLETREEVLQLYLKINAGGTPHTKEELDRVRGLLKEERGG